MNKLLRDRVDEFKLQQNERPSRKGEGWMTPPRTPASPRASAALGPPPSGPTCTFSPIRTPKYTPARTNVSQARATSYPRERATQPVHPSPHQTPEGHAFPCHGTS